MAVIKQVRERVFVPHRVALEFHRNRVGVVASRTAEFEKQRSSIEQVRDQAQGYVKQVARRAHGQDDKARDLGETLNRAFEEAIDFVDLVAEGYDLDPDHLASSPPDSIVVELYKILEGRVGPQPNAATLKADIKEAELRLQLKLPPGFGDKTKGHDANGDYLWWAEVIRYSSAKRPAAVIVVSNDVSKGDWVHEVRGLRIGPAPELVAEVAAASGASLHWATTSEFLAEVGHALGSAGVSEGTLQEARSSPLQAAVVDSIRAYVRSADKPRVSSSVANVALGVDPTLIDTAWAGAGSFRGFLAMYVPEFRFVIPPAPGYVMDPDIHVDIDVPGRSHESSSDAPSRISSDPGLSAEVLDWVRSAADMSPATLAQLGIGAELSPEMLEQLRRALAHSPDVLRTLRRLP